MIVLDTNLLARLLLKDDAAQHARVKALLATDQVFTAPVTVFLELVWVLEANECPAANVSRGLELLLGLPNFRSGQSDAFDKAFARQATRLALAPPVRTA